MAITANAYFLIPILAIALCFAVSKTLARLIALAACALMVLGAYVLVQGASSSLVWLPEAVTKWELINSPQSSLFLMACQFLLCMAVFQARATHRWATYPAYLAVVIFSALFFLSDNLLITLAAWDGALLGFAWLAALHEPTEDPAKALARSWPVLVSSFLLFSTATAAGL
ncbi:hypothetical protein K2X33_05435, partial [bacterium]|nr:hypothetical protein [bacterium]